MKKKFCVVFKKDEEFIIRSDEPIFDGKDELIQDNLEILYLDLFKDITIITDEYLARKIKHKDVIISNNYFLPPDYIFNEYRTFHLNQMNMQNKTEFKFSKFNEAYLQSVYNLYIGTKGYDKYVLKANFFKHLKYFPNKFSQYKMKLDKYSIYFLIQSLEGYFVAEHIIFSNPLLNKAFNTEDGEVLVPFCVFRDNEVIDYKFKDLYLTAKRKKVVCKNLETYVTFNTDVLGDLYVKYQVLNLFAQNNLNLELVDLRRMEFYSALDINCSILEKTGD